MVEVILELVTVLGVVVVKLGEVTGLTGVVLELVPILGGVLVKLGKVSVITGLTDVVLELVPILGGVLVKLVEVVAEVFNLLLEFPKEELSAAMAVVDKIDTKVAHKIFFINTP